ncbi:HYI isomerase, partial [Alopecoenas beccarii]|nr:HYI isomerase [Alopecoenas beccarii]
GDPEKGKMGLAAVPGRQDAFRQGLAAAVQYARAVGCPRMHLIAGQVPLGADRAAVAGEMETTFIENLRYAADLLAQVSREQGLWACYPLLGRDRDCSTAIVGCSLLNSCTIHLLSLPQDLFCCQIMDGNLSRHLETYFPLIGHIQIAQVPGWHEPNSPGELNFPYLFELLESLGYTGYMGCEYAPKGEWACGLWV